jgi:ATP-dependent DNA helicase RecG
MAFSRKSDPVSYSQLDRPVQFLKGVGPKRSDALKKLKIGTARDLLYHVPRRYDDASTIQPIASLRVGQDVTAVGHVRSKGIIPTRSGLRIFQLVLEDDSGYVTCSWPGQPWLERKILEGDQLLVTGAVKHFHGRQIHPREFSLISRADKLDEDESQGTVFVTYPATEDVPQWVLRRIFHKNLGWLLDQAGEDEYLSEVVRQRLSGLPGLPQAFRRLHQPESVEDPEGGRHRLAFDELFFLQLVQALARHRETVAQPGIEFHRTNELIRPLHESLSFELTGAQARVLREIFDDMRSPRRMNRFLQGDVGSGKTLVALFAMLLAVETGYQAVLMAPTELLAEQHWGTIQEMLRQAGLETEVVLLTGGRSTAQKRDVLTAIGEAGSAAIAVGTHALIEDGVRFRNLGLVVVDEQHRFGVRQRMALTEREKDFGPSDVLVMSATPIPRSLALTLYGDLDLSVLDDLPPGRKPVETMLRYPRQRSQVYASIDEEIAKGRQGYLVFPLVEETDKSELKAATQEYERLRSEVFSHRRLGLLHGQLSSQEKDAVMRAFRDGTLDLVIATSVVEVGIDVPNATVMVIEHAERFGLSQLHQLRGRVGRGAASSICILVTEPGEQARTRLELFCGTNDGFEIARADLQIRGQGDLFGAQQHGKDPLLRFADLRTDEPLLNRARQLARGIVADDPELTAPGNARIRSILEARHSERLRMWRVG